MFGNNGMQFTPADWQQLALTAGLSILGNNNGSRSVGQLIGQGGLDALAGLQARKQYEAAMARQREQDAMAQQKHDLAMRQGNAELEAAERMNNLKARFAAGDRSPEVMNGLYGKEMLAHDLAMRQLRAKQKMEEDAKAKERERQMNIFRSLGLLPNESGGATASGGEFKLNPQNMALLAQLGPEGKALLNAMTQAGRAEAGVRQENTKAANEYIKKLIEQRDVANNSLQQYDALDSLFEQGMKTGMLEKYKNNFAGFLEAMGANPEQFSAFGLNDPAMVAAFNSLQMTNIMNTLAKQKGVQTEGDAERASKTWANISNTEEGNRWINQYHRNIAERVKEKAYFLENEVRANGGNIGEAEKAWEEYAKTLDSVVPPIPKRSEKAPVEVGKMSDDELLNALNAATW